MYSVFFRKTWACLFGWFNNFFSKKIYKKKVLTWILSFVLRSSQIIRCTNVSKISFFRCIDNANLYTSGKSPFSWTFKIKQLFFYTSVVAALSFAQTSWGLLLSFSCPNCLLPRFTRCVLHIPYSLAAVWCVAGRLPCITSPVHNSSNPLLQNKDIAGQQPSGIGYIWNPTIKTRS